MKLVLFLIGAVFVLAKDLPYHKILAQEREKHQADIASVVAPPANEAVWSQCSSVVFNKAQYDFNNATGIPEEITWRQANSLDYAVNQQIFKGQMNTVCSARQQFAQTLGVTYPLCVNRFFLLSQGNTDYLNCVYYVHLYKHLEFTCSVAYEDYEYNLACIYQAQKSDDYQTCFKTFNNQTTTNPNGYCDNVDQLTKCVQTVTANKCGVPTGWIICERERVGFAYDCPNIQCKVPGQN